MNLQEAFLNQIRITKAPVSVYLTGGQHLKGVIMGFDNFSFMLDMGGKQALVYKHAVSSVVPYAPVTLFKEDEKKNSGGDME
ncbi:MAG: RNA chaperone Hfq [Oscillospiraceae bacterium]|nr:RNA chaperone Hfq [Oscillospiraceae bacterium]